MRQERFAPSDDARLLLVDDDPFTIHIMGRMVSQYRNQRFAGKESCELVRSHVDNLRFNEAANALEENQVKKSAA